MDTVRGDLSPALGNEDARTEFAPARRVEEFGEQRAGVKQTEGFSGQMRVWGKVIGEIAAHVRRVYPDCRDDLHHPLSRQPGKVAEEDQRPAPGDQPVGNLEAARPVDAGSGRIRLEPRVNRSHTRPGHPFVTGQRPGLGQRDDPLMTIQFPDDLAVAHHRRIERIDPTPVHER